MNEYAIHITSRFVAVSARAGNAVHWYKRSWRTGAPLWWLTISWSF